MIALLRRQPLVSYFVIAFAWTWAYNHTGGSILMAILVHASINFSEGLTGDLFPAAKNNEVAPVIAFALLAVVIVVMTRAGLGYRVARTAATAVPAYSTP